MKKLYLSIAFALLCFPALAQTWFSASPQITDGNTVTFTSTVTVRYGQNASTCMATFLTCIAGKPSSANWLPPVTIAATTANPVSIVVGTTWAGKDPNPGTYKQLQIGQLSTIQAIKVGGVTVTVPAMPVVVPPVPIPAVPTVIAKWNCDLNQMSDGTFTSVAGSCVKK
jgi:hypothetical protein